MKEVLDLIFKAIIVTIVVGIGGLACLAGLGAWGGFALAAAAGAGKGMALAAGAAGLVAAPALALGGFKLHRDYQKKQRDKRYADLPRASYQPRPVAAPAPAAPAPAPVPAAPKGDDTPPVFTDAMAKLEQLDPEDRRKYLGKLRDRFPNEVETLHDANDKMALQHDIKLAKPIVFAAKPGTAS